MKACVPVCDGVGVDDGVAETVGVGVSDGDIAVESAADPPGKRPHPATTKKATASPNRQCLEGAFIAIDTAFRLTTVNSDCYCNWRIENVTAPAVTPSTLATVVTVEPLREIAQRDGYGDH